MTLILQNVSKMFGTHTAVDNLNITIPKGSMFGFLGANGAGKTTIFRMILGLLPISKGSITFNGTSLDYKNSDCIGYLPEERGLHPTLTVKEEILYLAKLKNMSKKNIENELDYWLERFKIKKNKDLKIDSLSKGNQQKIQLIASIIHNPQLLILDEPFSGLDPVNVSLLKNAILELKSKGVTIIFSSHRMEHVEELCDQICIMKDGKNVKSGTIFDIKKNFTRKNVIIKGKYDFNFLKNYEGVIGFKKLANGVSITLSDEKFAENIFEKSIKLGYLKKFEVKEPSLNEIFIELVGEKVE
ncbi:ABC transporter ATP-binding protein [Staphylococcus sp. GSSP0090]|nr:ABC transporter ATP-binding protein [Staphylococcus sp. GSSP0090]